MTIRLMFVASLTLVAAPARAAIDCPAGIVVERVREGFAAHQAGLRAGDILCSWERAASAANPEPAQGDFAGIHDVIFLELEQAPRGELRVSALRGDERLVLRLPAARWGLIARGRLAEDESRAYQEADGLVREKKYEEGFAAWTRMARSWRDDGDHARAFWLFARLSHFAVEARRWPDADAAIADALREAQSGGYPVAAALTHMTRGQAFEARNEPDAAAIAYATSAEAFRGGGQHLLEASVLERLAIVTTQRGDLDLAEDHFLRCLSIRERFAAGSIDHAATFNNLGLIAHERGDLALAQERYRGALAINESFAAESLQVAGNLQNLGTVAQMRGDLAVADDYFRRALAMREKLRPDEPGVALSLNALGTVAVLRHDQVTAQDYLRRALAIREAAAPGSLDVAKILGNLGSSHRASGDLRTAREYLLRAAAIKEKLGPASLGLASTLAQLGLIAKDAHDWAAADGYLSRALSIVEAAAPTGLEASFVVQSLGDLARTRGDLTTAEVHYRRALAIRAVRAPGSADEAESHALLALTLREAGRREEALASLLRALDALETQRGRLGGSDEARSGFAAAFAAYYHRTVDLLVGMGRGEEAFQVLERYRARGLLALLAERDLRFTTDLSEDLDRQRRLVNAEYDRAFAELGAASAEAAAEKRQALNRVRLRRVEIDERIRAASPRLAALQSPQPLDVAATRAALDTGTLLLSYAVGDAGSYVFAVGPGAGEFAAVRLEPDAAALRRDVTRFRELLEEQATLKRGQLDRLARSLSRLLLRPVTDRIQRAQRVVVLPDGPLHLLPFAALKHPTAGGRYLIENVPLHVAASATVFAELKRSRRPATTARLVAFGDPDYSATAAREPARQAAPELRSAQARGLDLRALPASRREVDALRRLFPDKARVYLGREATEERAKAEGREATLLHFACHGLADEISPLDSSLVLSVPPEWSPGRPNGLLQAWEIFEQVRIDADLVTLSACGTALGREMSGEGILGLTRAFQYAGARSVLASLWTVRDDSTADLMHRFYKHLRHGRAKDAALRTAQVEMIRRPGSHPGGWAAFQLIGDWR
jgi:CHAT domain-containing protein/Tfp pilus assembly protein PilF